jgi:hypothetical protein
MRLSSFEVQGFKNLVAPVKLEGLGPISVLHGANSVGKSNLLRAIGVFFRLLKVVRAQDLRMGPPLDARYFVDAGVPVAELFNYAVPAAIHLSASLRFDDGELAVAGIQPVLDCDEVTIAMSLESFFGDALSFQVRSFRFVGGVEVTTTPPDGEQDLFALQVASYVASRALGPRGASRVGVHRLLDAAVDALYDASVSTDRRQVVQWNRFVEVMGAFRDILGDGQFIAVLPRTSPQAVLLYERPTMRIPLDALGSGVQQIVALFGHLLTCGASTVTVEEPERNLRWSLQERVRDALRDLVGKEGAPSQLFLTSHSGAFVSGDSFYLMQPSPGGPTVERRPVSDVPLVVGGPAPEGSLDAPRAPTHVSSKETLRLPDRIRKAVGVEHGGGVSFVDKGEGIVEMMSVDTFLKHAGLDSDGP